MSNPTPTPTRLCHICGTATATWCPTCTAAFPDRRAVAGMTVEERVAELDLWCGPLEIEFAKLHQRIEELVGRPVWTHELGTDGVELLKAEIRSGRRADMADVLAKIPAGKAIIVAEVPE